MDYIQSTCYFRLVFAMFLLLLFLFFNCITWKLNLILLLIMPAVLYYALLCVVQPCHAMHLYGAGACIVLPCSEIWCFCLFSVNPFCSIVYQNILTIIDYIKSPNYSQRIFGQLLAILVLLTPPACLTITSCIKLLIFALHNMW